MFKEVISKKAKDYLAVLGKSRLLNDFYLAGGTALALRIGHRVSVDFDFFTKKKFDEKILIQRFSSLPIDFQLERLDWGTILGYLNKTRFTLFFYGYPLLTKTEKFLNINVANIKDIAPMKVAAISGRGTKRDFIDLYFILAIEKFFNLKEVLEFYNKKFKILHQNKIHILKSLTYFDDAEGDVMPDMLKQVSWKEVKAFFEREVKHLTNF